MLHRGPGTGVDPTAHRQALLSLLPRGRCCFHFCPEAGVVVIIVIVDEIDVRYEREKDLDRSP